MNPIGNRIYLLDDISQSKIQYSVQILSLNDVILELIRNSLDAQAQNIKIVLNYTHGFCSVLDDGHGIPAREFEEDGGLGKPFHTSKSGRVHTSYGRNGRFLTALAGLSLLSIASRVDGGNTHVLWLDDTGRLRHARESPDTLDLETGTRVKVYNLFSKLPVRSKALLDRFTSSTEVQKEFDRLRCAVLGLVFASPAPFGVTIEHSSPKAFYRHKQSGQSATLPVQLSHKGISQVISAFRQIGLVEAAPLHQWQETSIQSGGLEIRGLIMKLPVAFKSAQYLSLNHLPITKEAQPDLYHTINVLFERSTFGTCLSTDIAEADDVQINRPSHGHAKGIDRWPMFVIWINTTLEGVHDIMHHTAMSSRAQKLLTKMISLVQTLIEEFLVVHGFSKTQKLRQSRALRVLNDGGKLKAISMDQRLEQSKESFRHWSRVKSTRSPVLDNILTGLPFHERPSPKPTDVSFMAEKPLSCDEESDTTFTDSKENSVATPSVSENGDNEHGHILWTDPQTGRVLRLDARTGMELPQHVGPTNIRGQNDVDSNSGAVTLCSESKRPRRPLRQASHGLSISQVAENIRHYSTKHSSRIDQPIRSISNFTPDGEDSEQYCSTYREKVESFWSMDHGISYSVPLQAPNISRGALQSAKVLRQVDRKFVLTMMRGYAADGISQSGSPSQLVLIDQHAADERCKVEALLRSVHSDKGITLADAIVFEVSTKESDLLKSAQSYFARWNILYEIPASPCTISATARDGWQQVRITSLPSAIAERCRLHPKLIIDILREGIWSDTGAFEHHKTLESSGPSSLPTTPMPPRLLEMINSRACRSAIMFNDILTIEQCETLVHQLSKCTLPFQCAHCRPSMVTLTDIDNLDIHRPLAPQMGDAKSYFESLDLNRAAPARRLSPTAHEFQPDSIDDDRDNGNHNNISRNIFKATPNALNTIDDNVSFGQAYHSWINS